MVSQADCLPAREIEVNAMDVEWRGRDRQGGSYAVCPASRTVDGGVKVQREEVVSAE